MIIESVADLITEHNEAIYTELRLGERPIGCIVKWDAPTKNFTFEKCQAQLLDWFVQRDNYQWVIGDFSNACDRIFKEAAANIPPDDDLTQLTGHTRERLYTWSSICNQYTHEQRLYPLRFSFYQEVAYVKPHTARAELLQWCVDNQASTKQLRDERNRRYPDAHQGLQWISDDNAPISNDNHHTMILDVDTVNQVRLGNLRGLSLLFKQWRGVMQSGKRYEIVLREVRD